MTTTLSQSQARQIWIRAQRLDSVKPFGKGAEAVQKCIEHLGYVQIDTISVIERCHHHILHSRIPRYKRQDLHQAQSIDKNVFEYWTHALSYIPTRDFHFYIPQMQRRAKAPGPWLARAQGKDLKRVLQLIRKRGPLSIRDIEDKVLMEKEHLWGSRKPSKKALELGFYSGELTISERMGMLKKYDLINRHFEWTKKPKAASESQYLNYILDRSLRSQGFVSLDSICHLNPKLKADVHKTILQRVKKQLLIPCSLQGDSKTQHWIRPEDLQAKKRNQEVLPHILSPFDPLIIQRKRLKAVFNYEHLFEAYVTPAKRVFGYFALPVLSENEIVAILDLKTDRLRQKLLIQKWSWLPKQRSSNQKKKIEESLHLFEKFQLVR